MRPIVKIPVNPRPSALPARSGPPISTDAADHSPFQPDALIPRTNASANATAMECCGTSGTAAAETEARTAEHMSGTIRSPLNQRSLTNPHASLPIVAPTCAVASAAPASATPRCTSRTNVSTKNVSMFD